MVFRLRTWQLCLTLAIRGACVLTATAALADQKPVSAPAAQQKTQAEADAAFMKIADRYLDRVYLETQPSTATALGVHRFDGELEDYSFAGLRTLVAKLSFWDKRFADVDPATLSEMVRGDRELLLGHVRSTMQTIKVLRPLQKNPDIYSSGITSSAFSLMERDFAPAEQRLKMLVAREQKMPEVLQLARTQLNHPPKIYTEIAIEQLPGLIAFFTKDVPLAFKDVKNESLNEQFRNSNAAVIEALTDYQKWLETVLLKQSTGEFRIGAEAFQQKLLFDEMVDTPLDRLLEIDLADMRANRTEFDRIAHELEPGKTPREVLEELGANHPSPENLLATFRGTFDGLVSFIQSKHIITIPSPVRPILEETPPFMRATTFASMDTPGPFEPKAKEAYFNVTLPEASWDAKKVAEFMAQFSYPVISSVATHEAYPGHYVQFLWMFDVHDRVRKILGANTNVEGWAHYCEQMMLDEGLAQSLFPNDKRQQQLLRLGQLQDALLRNARFYVGIKLHTTKMSLAEAEDFFVNEGYQSHAVAVVETKRGTSNPTYLYYTLGKLEIMKLRHDVAAREGKKFNLQKFHDDFMRQGSPPIAIVRRAMLHDDSPAL